MQSSVGVAAGDPPQGSRGSKPLGGSKVVLSQNWLLQLETPTLVCNGCGGQG